jgi:hypothetical protein
MRPIHGGNDMDWTIQDWGAVGEIVGGVAVVATLLYLAVQLRQNTISVKASAYQTWLSVVIAEQSAGQQAEMSKTLATGFFYPEKLTEDNWVSFANYCNLFVMKAESAYFLGKNSIIEESLFEKELDRAAIFLKTRGPEQWWNAGARTQFTDEFIALVEDRMSQSSEFLFYSFTPGKGFQRHQDIDDNA